MEHVVFRGAKKKKKFLGVKSLIKILAIISVVALKTSKKKKK